MIMTLLLVFPHHPSTNITSTTGHRRRWTCRVRHYRVVAIRHAVQILMSAVLVTVSQVDDEVAAVFVYAAAAALLCGG